MVRAAMRLAVLAQFAEHDFACPGHDPASHLLFLRDRIAAPKGGKIVRIKGQSGPDLSF